MTKINEEFYEMEYEGKYDDNYVLADDGVVCDCMAEVIEDVEGEEVAVATERTQQEPEPETKNSIIDEFDEKTQEYIKGDKKGHLYFEGRSFHIVINPKIMKRAKKIITYLLNLQQVNYLLAGKHIGEPEKEEGLTKKPHIHIYVQFRDSEKIPITRIKGAHIKNCYSDAGHNMIYIKCKDDKHKRQKVRYEEVCEWGCPRIYGGCLTQAEIIELYEMNHNYIKYLDARFYRVWKKIINDYEKKQAFKKWRKNVLKGKHAITVDWHIGAGGSGKTFTAAKETTDDDAIIDFTKDGQFANVLGDVEHAKRLIINEFKDSTIDFKTFLALLVNEKIVNIKGSQIYPACVEKIIITSQQKPREIYKKCGEDRNQINRRIDHIYYHYIENGEFKKDEVGLEF